MSSDDIIPVAAGEPARQMIKAWAESHGMTLYQGREGEKYPVRRWPKNAGYPCWEYVPWSGTGPAITQVHRYLATLDADDQEARELVASWDLPPHFATRGVSYSKGCITEHHYLSNFEGLKRILGMCPGLDFLANPDSRSCGSSSGTTDYEVISVQPGLSACRRSPDHRSSSCTARQRKSSASAQPPTAAACRSSRYRAEGIEHGQQSYRVVQVGVLPGRPQGAARRDPRRPGRDRRAQPDRLLGPLAGEPARQHGRPGLPAVRQAAHRRGAAGDGGPGPCPVPG